jgi:hypothetical protein
VIYYPSRKLVSVGGVYLGETTNNVVEYSTIIEILRDALLYGIYHLQVFMDSQLVVLQLNGVYQVQYPLLLWFFLRVHLLERFFEFITYEHAPRRDNELDVSYANYVLDWHVYHHQSKSHIDTCIYILLQSKTQNVYNAQKII